MTKEELVRVATEQAEKIQDLKDACDASESILWEHKEAAERLRKQFDALAFEFTLYQERVDELYKKQVAYNS